LEQSRLSHCHSAYRRARFFAPSASSFQRCIFVTLLLPLEGTLPHVRRFRLAWELTASGAVLCEEQKGVVRYSSVGRLPRPGEKSGSRRRRNARRESRGRWPRLASAPSALPMALMPRNAQGRRGPRVQAPKRVTSDGRICIAQPPTIGLAAAPPGAWVVPSEKRRGLTPRHVDSADGT
jgi:hypothetical protein